MKNKVFIINIISLFIFVMSLFAEEESVCPNKTNEACQGDTGSSREAGRESQECESYPSNGVVLDLKYLNPSDANYGVVPKKMAIYEDRCRENVKWGIRLLGPYYNNTYESIVAVIAASIHNILDENNNVEMKFVIGTKSSGQRYLFGTALKLFNQTSEFENLRDYDRKGKPKNLEKFYAIGLYLGLPKEPETQLFGYDSASHMLKRTDYYQAFSKQYADSDYENRDCFRTVDFRVANIDCLKRHIKQERSIIHENRDAIKIMIDSCESSLNSFGIQHYAFNGVRAFLGIDER